MTGHADVFEDGLFSASEVEREPSVLLRDRYQEPPFSVLERRSKSWQKRDDQWESLGIQSEIGRAEGLTYENVEQQYSNWYEVKNQAAADLGRPATRLDLLAPPYVSMLQAVNGRGGTSIFSPTLVELLLRWYSVAGDRVLDPFAGGSVRGIVSSVLQRQYTGIELSGAQVAANRAQQDLGGAGAITPTWIEGDSADLDFLLPVGYQADMILSCPPYAHLEQYSDDPRDLSAMTYRDFLRKYRLIIERTVAALAPDRFIAWVVGEVREKGGDGSLVGLVPDTIQAFRDAGAEPYNDHILVTPIGTAAVRTPRQFDASRKMGRIHEYALIFCNGDARRATERLGAVS